TYALCPGCTMRKRVLLEFEVAGHPLYVPLELKPGRRSRRVCRRKDLGGPSEDAIDTHAIAPVAAELSPPDTDRPREEQVHDPHAQAPPLRRKDFSEVFDDGTAKAGISGSRCLPHLLDATELPGEHPRLRCRVHVCRPDRLLGHEPEQPLVLRSGKQDSDRGVAVAPCAA